MIKKSIKYLFRTPLTSILFTGLFLLASMLLSGGLNMYLGVQKGMADYQETFTTVGSVTQKPQDIRRSQEWNQFLQRYEQGYEKNYVPYADAGSLYVKGADYLIDPVQRPFYGADMEGYSLFGKDMLGEEINRPKELVVELRPVADCTLEQPVEMQIVNMLYGYESLNGIKILVVGNDPGDQTIFYQDKTYIMCLDETIIMEDVSEEVFSGVLFTPIEAANSTQYIDGGTVAAGGTFYEEVTENFYDTPAGHKWQELVKAIQRYEQTIPVMPADSSDLILPLHTGKAFLSEGADITREEYENGERVCLIGEDFAKRNNLKIGDEITLPLYFANYATAPQLLFIRGGYMWYDFGLVDQEGKAYPVFSEHTYRIKGFYQSGAGYDSMTQMPLNAVVIPANSVRESDHLNIAAYGPMRNGNTTFQIANGRVEEFLENWQSRGDEMLEFEFFDRGYSAVEGGIKRMEKLALILLAVGVLLSFGLILFFGNIFIVRQRQRITVERLLGVTRRQGLISLTAGFLLLALIAVTAGSIGGRVAGGKIMADYQQEMNFDLTYSNLSISMAENEEVSIPETSVGYVVLAGLGIFGLTGITALLLSRKILNDSPMEMLSKNQR